MCDVLIIKKMHIGTSPGVSLLPPFPPRCSHSPSGRMLGYYSISSLH